MKIAVLADIHANFPALQAAAEHLAAWQPDHVIVAGDLVNRGPRPLECLRFVARRVESLGWRWLRGNHEDYVLHFAQPDAQRDPLASEVHRPSIWTGRQLGDALSLLEQMPPHLGMAAPDNRRLHFTHGSMLGLREGIYPETSDSSLKERIGLNGANPTPGGAAPLALFCVGHTHRPLVRWLEGVLVVNAGSLGLPFDGDSHPSYARLTWRAGVWQAEIVRLDYDQAQAERDFYDTGYLTEAGPLAELVLIEMLQARSMLYQWAVQYQGQVLSGEISMAESVRAFKHDHELTAGQSG